MIKRHVLFRLLSTLFILVIFLLTIALTACKKPDDNDEGNDTTLPVEVVDTKASAVDVINKILNGAQNVTSVDTDAFNVKVKSKLEIPQDGSEDIIINLLMQLSLDLDVTQKDKTSNIYLFELTQFKNGKDIPIINLYYKDSLTETPYIYANIAEKKHAIKATSIKKVLLNGAPGLFDPYVPSDKTTEATDLNITKIIGDLLGSVLPTGNLTVEQILEDMINGLFKNGYIDLAAKKAGLVLNSTQLNSILNLLSSSVTTISGLDSDVNLLLKALGIDLTFEKILDVIGALPEFSIKVDAGFNDSWGLEKITVDTFLKNGLNLNINSINGNKIIDLVVPDGSTVKFELFDLEIKPDTVLTTLPDGLNLINYTPHNLINFELEGVARLEYLKEINDGQEIWNASKAYKYFVKADLDPFAILNGVDAANLENTIKMLGKFNILVVDETDTATNTIVEIAFDPMNSNDDGLYVNLTLQAIGALAGPQTVKFDITDLIEYLFNTDSATRNLPQNAEGDSSGSSSIVFGTISKLLNSLDFIVHPKNDYAEFGYSINLRKIPELAQYIDLLLGYSGERLYVGFNSIKYGVVDSNYNAYENFKNTATYVVDIAPHESVMTEYEYGQSFQGGYTTIDMLVTYSEKGVIDSSTIQKSLKVIKLRGFDPLKVGEQTIELYLIAPPKSAGILNSNLAIYNEFASANLPYGIMKYTYKIVVKEPAKNVAYFLENDYVFAGDNIFDSSIKTTESMSTVIKVKSFKLYADENMNVESNAIDRNGVVINPGKYWIQINTGTTEEFSQVIYINKIVLPDLTEKLIVGNLVSSLDGIVTYYDEQKGTVITESVRAQQNTPTTTYVNIKDDIIKGNGLKPNIGSDSYASIKWVYNIATNGLVTTKETSRSGLQVKFSEAVLNAVSISTTITTYDGMLVVNVGTVLRSDGKNNYYVDTSNKNGLRWINGQYQVIDTKGNIIAKKVSIVIRETASSTDVTDIYYDKNTGRFKIRTDELGNPVYFGSSAIPELSIGITFEYDDLSATTSTKLSLYPKYRINDTSSLSIKQYNPLPSKAFTIYAFNNVLKDYDSSVQIKYNPDIGYYVRITNRIYLISAVFYELNSENVINNALSPDGRILLDPGKYTARLSADIEGTIVSYLYTITVNTPNQFKAEQGAQITAVTSLQYADPMTCAVQSSGKFRYTENGYIFEASSSKFIVNVGIDDIEIYDADGELLDIKDIIDSDGRVIGEIGEYKIIINVQYSVSHIFKIGGVLIIS
ncbi:MAG: hypothetical protein LBF68_08640 [Christensenellaceae bacterium]|jgi:hypothetical protein|nr:hypothetical protein [Christensenellaceae bacterium]